MGRKRTSIDKVCVNCGNPYTVQAHRASSKFCSMTCLWQGRPTMKRDTLVLTSCQQCEGTYRVKPHRIGKTKFCSRRCGMIGRRHLFEDKRHAAVAALDRRKQAPEIRSAKKRIIGEAYYRKNKKLMRTKHLRYYEANKPLFRANSAKYEADKIRATPSWADLQKIKAIYAEAARLTRETGIPHEVDHYYPLRSKMMCGLHVETNLQILVAETNRKKSNSIPVAPILTMIGI